MQNLGWLPSVIFLVTMLLTSPAAAQAQASPWVDQERAKSRIVAASTEAGLVAFFEIEMPVGWKTYWRNPGDAGGLPPSFDLSQSSNVSGTEVLYPAPLRLGDKSGETIGYQDQARFPILVSVSDQAQAVTLKAKINFGVCKDICVPLEVTHELTILPGRLGPADGELRETWDRVPRAVSQAQADTPRLTDMKIAPDDPTQLSFTVLFPEGFDGADLFVEGPEGFYVPMPKRVKADGHALQFNATFASADELKALIGKPLKVTMVSATRQSEATIVVP